MRCRAAIIAFAALGGCADDVAVPEPETALERGAAYVDDIDFRRDALVASIVNANNSYSTLRLAEYGRRGEGWEMLPVWNPPVRPVGGDEDEFAEVFDPIVWTDDALLELGRRAFESFPVQLNFRLAEAAESESGRDRYGLWVDDRGRIGGLVTVELPSGRTDTALTCATCHASVASDGRLEHGRVNGAIDVGLFNAHAVPPGERQDRLLAWGPGRVDVTPDDRDNPTAIGDLRAIRFQSHLHSAATLHNDLIALAVRIETLIITSLGTVARPPREVSFAMAWYLWNLDARAASLGVAEPEGARLFERNCAACHASDGSTAAPVPIEAVGTDPAVGLSPARGTGAYRIPSLWGASTRSQLLHTASVHSLEELLDPARLEQTPGHPFGTHLPSDERAALVRYVETLGD